LDGLNPIMGIDENNNFRIDSQWNHILYYLFLRLILIESGPVDKFEVPIGTHQHPLIGG
jgi:hypothetical protein